MRRLKIILILWLCLTLLPVPVETAAEEETVQEEGENGQSLVQAPSALLMEARTGTVLYEKNADERRSPASITKIMTLILIYDALDSKKLKMEDVVTTSAYAKSMGGSQVFLEEGETQTVETLIKCIVVASGNDASVAMAEHISGSEQEFVKQMNQRAEALGMKNTHFEDCCGLTDSAGHYTTARDIAIMSRELVERYPEILNYSSIWMENITHVTRQGTSEFGLTNTNKLLRSYEGCVGLKTGSTSMAKYCFSGVAIRNGITLIATVMAAPDYKVRFRDAAAMLNYGFSRCSLFEEKEKIKLPVLEVEYGVQEEVPLNVAGRFCYLSVDGTEVSDVKRKIRLPKSVQAPVKKGDPAGKVIYFADGKEIGSMDILYAKSVKRASYADCIRNMFRRLIHLDSGRST